jgi:hypothetical protein
MARTNWLAAVAAVALTSSSSLVAAETPARTAENLPAVAPSEQAARLMQWIEMTDDNGTSPYIVIDKNSAALFLFDAEGKQVGQTPVLIGIAKGDDSSPGVGSKSLASLGPAEKTTPAGRFVARFGRAAGNRQVLWVDYATSVALHIIVTGNRRERRLDRLFTPEADDNRITFGCINVGATIYTKQLQPLFRRNGGVVYILPDTKPIEEVFPRLRMLPYLEAEQAS